MLVSVSTVAFIYIFLTLRLQRQPLLRTLSSTFSYLAAATWMFGMYFSIYQACPGYDAGHVYQICHSHSWDNALAASGTSKPKGFQSQKHAGNSFLRNCTCTLTIKHARFSLKDLVRMSVLTVVKPQCNECYLNSIQNINLICQPCTRSCCLAIKLCYYTVGYFFRCHFL